METKKFADILSDKHFYDFKKMSFKYACDFNLFLDYFKDIFYTELPLRAKYGARTKYKISDGG